MTEQEPWDTTGRRDLHCNGSLTLERGNFDEVVAGVEWDPKSQNFGEVRAGTDVIFLIETHQSPERGLPHVSGFVWESAFRDHTQVLGGIKGSRGWQSYTGRSYTGKYQSKDMTTMPNFFGYGLGDLP